MMCILECDYQSSFIIFHYYNDIPKKNTLSKPFLIVVSKPSIFTFGFFSHLFLDHWYLVFFFPVWSLWIKADFCTLWTDILFARYVGTTTTTFSILYSSSNTQKIALWPFWKAMVQSDNHLCQCYYINKKSTLGAKICPDIFLSFF